jgi:hypothetical protein
MRRSRLIVVLVASGAILVLGLSAFAWTLGTGSSEAQQDAMQNCPQASKWAISVWSGDDDTDTGEALATCGAGVVDFAYSLDRVTNNWQSYFLALPAGSTLQTLDDMQGVVAHGAVGAPAVSATPAATATPLATPSPTATPTLTPITSEQLIQPTGLTYVGAFRLPDGPEEIGWAYSGAAMTYYPHGDPDGPADGYPGSIFATGHDWNQYVSEISIPVPIISPDKDVEDLNTATTLQDFQNIRGDLFGEFELPRVGLEYLPAQGEQTTDKLYFCWAQHMGETETNPSHGWCELDLSNPQTAGAWRIGDYWNYVTTDYIFAIPQQWANANTPGMYLATGRFRDGGQGAQGPSLLAHGPWNEGNPPAPNSTLSAVPLLLYADVTAEDDFTMDNYQHSDGWSGGAWLTAGDKSAVVFVGTKGLGDCWYGFANGVVWPDEPPYPPVPDAPYDQRGWWSTSFEGQIIFYDPADLAAVARGEMESYEPQPYATLQIDEYLYDINSTQPWYHVGAASFDRERGLLHVFEPLADEDKSLIHVWEVAAEEATASGLEAALNYPHPAPGVGVDDGVSIALAEALGAGSSEAQQDAMQNCPQPGRWAISVWSGQDGTDTGEALATCGAGMVDFAYSLDPTTNSWQSYFMGLAQISTMPTMNNLQGVIAHGTVGAPAPSPTPAATTTPVATASPTAMPTAGGDLSRVIFLHHSVGANLIEQGGIRQRLTDLGYEFYDHGYNDDGLVLADGTWTGLDFNVPDDNTEPDGLADIFAQPLHEPPDNTFSHLMQYDVIAFKSCFTASLIDSPQQLDQYKSYYLSIRDRMDQDPNKVFIVVTPPPQIARDTDLQAAARARAFADWLASNEYVGGHPNVFTFDLFDLLADPSTDMLRADYQIDEHNAHPSQLANQTIGPLFADFIDQAVRAYTAP